jgi:type II secretory pathway component PulF
MAELETKLKLGRKVEGVEASVASANQVSALFRFDPDTKQDGHVSLSVESDHMTAEDVAAVFQLLHQRGVLPAKGSKTWLNQPQASEAKFGKTTTWKGTDLKNMVDLLSAGLPVRDSLPSQGNDAALKLRDAQMKVQELSKKVEELRAALGG